MKPEIKTLIVVILLVLLGEFVAEIFAQYGTLIIECVLGVFGFLVFFRLRKSRK